MYLNRVKHRKINTPYFLYREVTAGNQYTLSGINFRQKPKQHPIGYTFLFYRYIYTQTGIMSLAVFLKEKRKSVQLTQTELAEKAGVGLRFVRELEQGKQSLRLDKVNQVLQLFGYEIGAVPTVNPSN